MKATAIIYEMPKKERKEQEKIRRKLFGYVDKSNKCIARDQNISSLFFVLPNIATDNLGNYLSQLL